MDAETSTTTLGCASHLFTRIGVRDDSYNREYWTKDNHGVICARMVRTILKRLPDKVRLTVMTQSQEWAPEGYFPATLIVRKTRLPGDNPYRVFLPYDLAFSSGLIGQGEFPQVDIFYGLGRWLRKECGLTHKEKFYWKIEEVT